jgi:hypothetical protein
MDREKHYSHQYPNSVLMRPFSACDSQKLETLTKPGDNRIFGTLYHSVIRKSRAH